MSRIQGTGRFALFCGAVLSMALVVACGGYEGQLSGQDGFLNTAAARVISLAGESAAIVSSATAVQGAATDSAAAPTVSSTGPAIATTTVLPTSPTTATVVSSATAVQTVATAVTAAPTASTTDPTIVLSGLPSSGTTETKASIGFQVDSGGVPVTVYCQLAPWGPIVCPNPFELGMSPNGPLNPGLRTVNFYIDRGTGIDVAKPDKSYSWTIVATNTSTAAAAPPASTSTSTTLATVATSPTTSVPTTATTSPVSALTGNVTPLPVVDPPAVEAAGYDMPPPDSIVGASSGPNAGDGIVRFQKFTDVLGTGRRGYLLRARQGDPQMWGGLRAVFSWYNKGAAGALQTGRDYWFAYASYAIPGEFPYATGVGTDQGQIGMATHAYADVPTVFGNFRYGQNGAWAVMTNGNPQTVGGAPLSEVHPVGRWHKNIVHVRLGSTTASSPRIEWWVDGIKRIDLSGMAAAQGYADAANGFYLKMGLYVWYDEDTFGSYGPSTRAMYFSDMHFAEGNGSDMYARAEASLAGF